MKLKSIYIKGFKNPDRAINLTFSDEPISVIYGVNGSGKTTLLKILHAIFNKNDNILIRENVQEIQVEYEINKELYKANFKRKNKQFDWGKQKHLFESSSILFGLNRGVLHQSMQEEEFINIFSNINKNYKNSHSSDMFHFRHEIKLYDEAVKYFKNQENTPLFPKEKKHISADFISIIDIKKALISEYRKGQNIVLEKINNAFFETIENAFSLEENGGKLLELPDNFEAKIKAQQDFVSLALNQQKETQIVKRLKKYIETGDRTVLNHSNILRALLLNILEKAEEPNATLEAIQTLITAFNDHLYYDKKLVIEAEKAYIQFKNGRSHSLADLSSGERHLLSLLTLFLILGRDRNFFFIDEPELSLNIKWQRQLLPLLSKLNPNSQIIAATHSPAIANENSNYLVELI